MSTPHECPACLGYTTWPPTGNYWDRNSPHEPNKVRCCDTCKGVGVVREYGAVVQPALHFYEVYAT